MATVEGIWYPLSAEVLIWNVDDIIKARKDYRVLGCYLGQDPRSTGGGLPLKLMKDEVSLLLEGDILKLKPYKEQSHVAWTYPQTKQEVSKRLIFTAIISSDV
jgi:hypothetical protein